MTSTLEILDKDLEAIKNLIDAAKYQPAEKALNIYLTDNPDCERGMFLLGRVYMATGRAATAAVIYRACMQIDARWQVKVNLAKCYDLLLKYNESERIYSEVRDDETAPEQGRILGWSGYTTTLVQQHRTQEAIRECEKFLEKHPGHKQVRINYGFALLQDRQFGPGWKYYEDGLGELRWRDRKSFQGEDLWDGRTGKDVNLLVYCEQGLGDQIVGVEPLRDAMEAVNVVGLQCDKMLVGYFQRSFPEIPVFHRAEDCPKIPIDFSCPVFSLHRYFRQSEDAYTKKPFLIPDPVRSEQWHHWCTYGEEGKITVGLCWSGGTSITGKVARRGDLFKWGPIFRALKGKARFISLEHKDRKKEIANFNKKNTFGVQVEDYPWASRSRDFDDAAALIRACDIVLGVPGTAIHAAGAMGIPTYLMVHGNPNIHYHAHGDEMAYYRGTHMVRRPTEDNDNWGPSCERIADLIIQEELS